MKKMKNKKGFTLVECVVAIAIIVMMTLPLMSTLIISSKIEYNVSDIFGAKNLANGTLKAFQYSETLSEFETKIDAVYDLAGTSGGTESSTINRQIDINATESAEKTFNGTYTVSKFVADGTNKSISVYCGTSKSPILTLTYTTDSEFQTQWNNLKNASYMESSEETYKYVGTGHNYGKTYTINRDISVIFSDSTLTVEAKKGSWTYSKESLYTYTDVCETQFYSGTAWNKSKTTISSNGISFDTLNAALKSNALQDKILIYGKYTGSLWNTVTSSSYTLSFTRGTIIPKDTSLTTAVIKNNDGTVSFSIKDNNRTLLTYSNAKSTLSEISSTLNNTSVLNDLKSTLTYSYSNTESGKKLVAMKDGSDYTVTFNGTGLGTADQTTLNNLLTQSGTSFNASDRKYRHPLAKLGNEDIDVTVEELKETTVMYVISATDLDGSIVYFRKNGNNWERTSDYTEVTESDKNNFQTNYQNHGVSYLYSIKINSDKSVLYSYTYWWLGQHTDTTSKTCYYITAVDQFGTTWYYNNNTQSFQRNSLSFPTGTFKDESAANTAITNAGAFTSYDNAGSTRKSLSTVSNYYYRVSVSKTKIEHYKEQYSIHYTSNGSTYYWNGTIFSKSSSKVWVSKDVYDSFMTSISGYSWTLNTAVSHTAKISSKADSTCGEWYKFGSVSIKKPGENGAYTAEKRTNYKNKIGNEVVNTEEVYDIICGIGSVKKTSNTVTFYDTMGGEIYTFEYGSAAGEKSLSEEWNDYIVNGGNFARQDDNTYVIKDGLSLQCTLVASASTSSKALVETDYSSNVIYKHVYGSSFEIEDGLFDKVTTGQGAVYTSLYKVNDTTYYTVFAIVDYRSRNTRCVCFVVDGDWNTHSDNQQKLINEITIDNYITKLAEYNIELKHTTGVYTKG